MSTYLYWTLVHLALTVVNILCAYYIWPHGWAVICGLAAGSTLTMAAMNYAMYKGRHHDK